ncbi:MAG TPA: cytochrome c [Longimicrobiales bacterium]
MSTEIGVTTPEDDGFAADVERIHRPLLREPRDPDEGREPVPWWLWTAAVLALFWGGWYLGRHGGEPGTATHIAYVERAAPASAGRVKPEESVAAAAPVELGRQVYARSCQGCHQASGTGLPGAFPPLVGSEWVTGPPATVIRILLDGLQGPIEVAGTVYNGVMPAWRDQLTDVELAAVATYIRQWGENDAGAVEAADVAELRAASAGRTGSWSAEALRRAEESEVDEGRKP